MSKLANCLSIEIDKTEHLLKQTEILYYYINYYLNPLLRIIATEVRINK